MSKELKGRNGKIVGTMEYFDKINESCKIDFVVKRYDLNYYASLKKISDKFSKSFDEVYSDLKSNEKYLSYIDKDDKKKTSEIIKGMLGLSKMVGGYVGNANKCLDYLAKSDKSKSGASDSDITKSARYVLSNKYFNKKDSIKILEDYIKNGEKTAINGDPNKKSFIKEVMRSSKSGYLADVLLKVNYLDSGKKLTENAVGCRSEQ